MTESIEDYAARQAAEYGTYVANGPITFNGALAYNTDHPVPTSNVEKYGYLESGLVRLASEPAPVAPAPPPLPVGEPIELTPTTIEEKD